jgi:hypothetical protein
VGPRRIKQTLVQKLRSYVPRTLAVTGATYAEAFGKTNNHRQMGTGRGPKAIVPERWLGPVRCKSY